MNRNKMETKVRRKSRLWALVMTGTVLMTGVLSACAPKGSKTEQEVVSILAKNSWYTTIDYEECAIIKQVEADSGYQINWNLRQPSSYYDAVRPMLLSGKTELADIIQLPDLDSNMEYIQTGGFAALDEYLDRMPNFSSFLDANPDIKASLTAEDGHIYYVPQTVLTSNYQPCIMYNQKWLKKLGLTEPSNLDEFVSMLRLFVENDMNGNGDPTDEIPMSVMADFLPYMFGSAFGLDLVSGFYADDEGVVHYAYCEDQYQKFLSFLKELYDEGLLEGSYETLTREKTAERCALDQTGVIFDYSWQMSSLYDAQYPDYNESNPAFTAGRPLSGEYEGYYVGRTAISGLFGVNKKSEHLDGAIELLDKLMSTDSQNTYCWGIQGSTYEVDEEGNRYYTEEAHNDEWLQNQGINPVCVPSQQSLKATNELVPLWHRRQDKFLSNYVRAPFPFIYATKDEAERMSGYANFIAGYVDTKRNEFITGRENLNEFGSYLRTLEDMNIEDMIHVRQQQYDRYQKNVTAPSE